MLQLNNFKPCVNSGNIWDYNSLAICFLPRTYFCLVLWSFILHMHTSNQRLEISLHRFVELFLYGVSSLVLCFSSSSSHSCPELLSALSTQQYCQFGLPSLCRGLKTVFSWKVVTIIGVTSLFSLLFVIRVLCCLYYNI